MWVIFKKSLVCPYLWTNEWAVDMNPIALSPTPEFKEVYQHSWASAGLTFLRRKASVLIHIHSFPELALLGKGAFTDSISFACHIFFFCEEGVTVSTQTRNLGFAEVKWTTQSHIRSEYLSQDACEASVFLVQGCMWVASSRVVSYPHHLPGVCSFSFLSVHPSWSCMPGWWTWPAQLENRAVSHCASCWNSPAIGLFPLSHNCTI